MYQYKWRTQTVAKTYFISQHFSGGDAPTGRAGGSAQRISANVLLKCVKNVTKHLKCLSGNKCAEKIWVVVLVNIKTSGCERNCPLNAVLLTIWKRPFRLLPLKKWRSLLHRKYLPHQTEGTISLHPQLSFDPRQTEAGLVKVVYTWLESRNFTFFFLKKQSRIMWCSVMPTLSFLQCHFTCRDESTFMLLFKTFPDEISQLPN